MLAFGEDLVARLALHWRSARHSQWEDGGGDESESERWRRTSSMGNCGVTTRRAATDAGGGRDSIVGMSRMRRGCGHHAGPAANIAVVEDAQVCEQSIPTDVSFGVPLRLPRLFQYLTLPIVRPLQLSHRLLMPVLRPQYPSFQPINFSALIFS